MGRNILTERRGGVLTITVNRPEKLNALNLETIEELTRAFEEARLNRDVRCIILTGAGDRAFIAGADIQELNRLDPVRAKEFSAKGNALISLIENLGKPVLAAINGFALGGGCEVALGCTLRLASDKARLGQPEIKLGIMPGFGGSQRLARICGRATALELCLLGDPVDARRALEIGLVHRVFPHEKLAAEARALAARIAASASVAVQYTLEAIHRGAECSLQEGLEFESHLFALCFATRDMKEGTSAFLEKRTPDFQGC